MKNKTSQTVSDIAPFNLDDFPNCPIYNYPEEFVELRKELEKVTKERDAALAVVDEFIADTTVKNETPIHECEFVTDPEKGKCDACEAWGNYVGLFCSSEEEETQ